MSNHKKDKVNLSQDADNDDVFIDTTDFKLRLEKTGSRSNPVQKFVVKKHHKQDEDDPVLCVASFDSNFTAISGVSPINSTHAWVHNFDTVKLIDITKGEILWQLESKTEKGKFHRICGYTDEKSFLYLYTPQIIQRMDTNSTVSNVLQNTFGSGCNAIIHISTFKVTRKGEIVVCVNKEWGCLCCLNNAPFIQLYTIEGKLIIESRLKYEGRNLLKQAFDIVQNNNDDICIAGEKCVLDYSEWVIVLDKDFKFKFTYEGENGNNYSCSSLAVSSNNEILIVSELQFIDIISENGKFLRRFPVTYFDAEGLPNAIANDRDGNIWITTGMDKLVFVRI